MPSSKRTSSPRKTCRRGTTNSAWRRRVALPRTARRRPSREWGRSFTRPSSSTTRRNNGISTHPSSTPLCSCGCRAAQAPTSATSVTSGRHCPSVAIPASSRTWCSATRTSQCASTATISLSVRPVSCPSTARWSTLDQSTRILRRRGCRSSSIGLCTSRKPLCRSPRMASIKRPWWSTTLLQACPSLGSWSTSTWSTRRRQ
mmetsp:Transcript_124365/g.265008  ORF Transcript_124365/g.265008 Transcript_124365/m.265008 type:complete len:202 (-) Transcript_124365:483-1088(-)